MKRSTYLSALLEHITVTFVVVAWRAGLGVHVWDVVGWHVPLKGGPEAQGKGYNDS